MAILKNRPLFSACLFYIICIFCARITSPYIKIGICGACIVLFVLCMLLFFAKKLSKGLILRVSVCLLCAALAFGGAYLTFDHGQQTYENIAQAQECTVEATVTERTASEMMTVYRIRMQKIDGEQYRFDGQLVCYFASYLQVGDSFSATVEPQTYKQLQSVVYDADYALADGVRMQFVCEKEADIQDVKSSSLPVSVALFKLNDALCRIILKFCGNESGGLVCALLLGNKSFLSPTLARDFCRAGASHMLALSGMHVSILIAALGFLLGKLRMHRKARAVFLALASVGYLVLTGMSVSATRAVAMVCILQLSYLLAADNDTLTTLGLVGAVILLIDPYSVGDTGFILSFLATFGIVVLVPPLHTFLSEKAEAVCKPPHYDLKKRIYSMGATVPETLLIGVIATFSVMVPSCLLIGNVSLFSPLTTLLLSPIVSAMLVMGSALLLLSPIPPLANLCASLIRLLYALMTPYTEGISRIDGALLPLTYDAICVLSVLFCVLMLVLLVLQLRKKLLLALPPALLCISLCMFYPINASLQQSTLRAAYTHPSGISETVVSANGYRAYICDLSSGSGIAAQYATHASAELHATEIGAILLTDYHTMQGAALTNLFSEIKTDLLYLPHTEDPEDIDTQRALCEVAQRQGVEVLLYRYGEPVEWYEGTRLTVHRTDLARSEQPVLVITVERGDACISVIGASARNSKLDLQAASAAKAADVLIIPERGPVPKLTYSLPIRQGTDVVFATRELASFISPEDARRTGSMTVCPEIAYFTLATAKDP